jgi:hypothetical protein
MDNLGPLMIVPSHILDKVYIVYSDLKPYVYEGYKAIGIRDDQLILLKENEWFHANRVYAFVDGRPFITFGGPCFRVMRDKFAKFFNTTNIIPTDYGLTNRNPGWRHISNFKEMIEAYRNAFPEIDWKVTPDFFPTLNETAHAISKLRILFVIYGAGANRAIFMHKNTVVCLGCTDVFDYSNLRVIAGSEHFVYCWPTTLKQWESGHDIKIEVAVNAMRECLRCDKEKKWR